MCLQSIYFTFLPNVEKKDEFKIYFLKFTGTQNCDFLLSVNWLLAGYPRIYAT